MGFEQLGKVKDDKIRLIISFLSCSIFLITSVVTTAIYFLFIYLDTSIVNLKIPLIYPWNPSPSTGISNG